MKKYAIIKYKKIEILDKKDDIDVTELFVRADRLNHLEKDPTIKYKVESIR